MKVSFKDLIKGIGNDFKISIDDLTSAIICIHEDIEELKISKPDKSTAKALLEYIAMEDCKVKENWKILGGKEIKKYLEWLEKYCKENSCTEEQVLNMIISGKI